MLPTATLERLREIPEFGFTPPGGCTWEQIATYIATLYDKNSDLIKQYPDFRMRKERVVGLVGFKKGKGGKYPEEIEDVFLGKNPEINKAIVTFVTSQNDPDWLLYITYSTLLAADVEATLEANDPKKRETIRKNIAELVAQIREAEASLFGGRETEEMRRALYANMEKQKMSLRPEDMARDIQSGEVNL